jgi:hypothetical protein
VDGVKGKRIRRLFRIPNPFAWALSREADPQGADSNSMTHICYHACISQSKRRCLSNAPPWIRKYGDSGLVDKILMTNPWTLPPLGNPFHDILRSFNEVGRSPEPPSFQAPGRAKACISLTVVGQRRSAHFNWTKVSSGPVERWQSGDLNTTLKYPRLQNHFAKLLCSC